jgi:hypothetical protein
MNVSREVLIEYLQPEFLKSLIRLERACRILARLEQFCVCICLQLFGGALIGLSGLPAWISWMKYVSVFRYSVEVRADFVLLDVSFFLWQALAVNEMKGQTYMEELTINETW